MVMVMIMVTIVITVDVIVVAAIIAIITNNITVHYYDRQTSAQAAILLCIPCIGCQFGLGAMVKCQLLCKAGAFGCVAATEQTQLDRQTC